MNNSQNSEKNSKDNKKRKPIIIVLSTIATLIIIPILISVISSRIDKKIDSKKVEEPYVRDVKLITSESDYDIKSSVVSSELPTDENNIENLVVSPPIRHLNDPVLLNFGATAKGHYVNDNTTSPIVEKGGMCALRFVLENDDTNAMLVDEVRINLLDYKSPNELEITEPSGQAGGLDLAICYEVTVSTSPGIYPATLTSIPNHIEGTVESITPGTIVYARVESNSFDIVFVDVFFDAPGKYTYELEIECSIGSNSYLVKPEETMAVIVTDNLDSV